MSTPFFRRRTHLPYPLEFLGALVARLLYRVRTSGAEHIPAQGGALLIANHLSYVDVVVLPLASPRPIRFVAFEGLVKHWFFDWCLRLSGTILISPRKPMDGMKAAIRALQAGDLVCVFPEGQISRTGQLMRIMRGYEVMARQANVPVVPAAIDGLWGSVFSFAGNKYLWKSPRLMPTHVFVAFGAPVPPQEATPAWARRALLDLGTVAFEERPTLKRFVAREIVRALARWPGKEVIVDRTAERRSVKSAQLLGAAAVLEKRIRATIPEKRVGIVLPPGAGAFIANLAVMCAGKTPVNLNFTAGRSSVEAAMRMGGVGTVISAGAMRAKLPGFPWPARTLDLRDEMAAAGGKRAIAPWLIAAWVLPNQLFANLLRLPHRGDREEAALLFTSGSAGEPKGVVLTHRNILANCAQISSLSILPRTCTMLGSLPVFHSFGFTMTMWYPMLRGCRVVTIPSPLDTRKMVEAIRDDQATVMLGPPTFLRPLLKKAQPAELRSLDLVITGAEKLSQDLYDDFLRIFHVEILQGYGLTETTPVANVNQPHPRVVTDTGEPQIGKKVGSVGRLVPGMTGRVVDPDTGADLPLTATGIVYLRGANVFPGYLDDPEKNRAAFHDGWFVTGDIGRFDEDGFLYIEGRMSRFSKIGGEMVPHGTIEQKTIETFALDQSEGLPVVVVGIPDAAKGEALVLLTTSPIAPDELRTKLLGAGLPNLWVPRQIYPVDRVPVLGTGKIDFKACRARAIDLARESARG